MRRAVVWCASKWLAVLACVLGSVLSPASASVAASPVPAFDHVFVIAMENHSYSQIIGNSQAPFINQLARLYGVATDYHGVAHPSLPNYLALVGGSTFGITSDCTTCFVNQPNLAADRIAPSGRSWKAYMESMPSPCFVGSSSNYAQKHDPFIYFDDIRKTSSQCNNIVPYTHLAGDLASTSTTPDYAFITPNLCNDMHDCSVSTGDTWLKNNVSVILNSPAYTSQNSLVMITWDEDDGSQSNQVATLVITRGMSPGFRSNVHYTHYSLLKTIEQAWGLAPLTTNDANASPMSDFFSGAGGPPPTPTPSPRPSPSPSPSPTSTPTPSPTPTPGPSPTPGTGKATVVHETNLGASDTTAATVTIPATAAGNSLIAIAALRTGVSKSLATITDSSGTSWTPSNKIVSAAAGVNGRVEIWWRENIPAGINTVQLRQGTGQAAITAWGVKVVEVHGLLGAASLDTATEAQNRRTTNLLTGWTTASADGEFAIGVVATSGTGAAPSAKASASSVSGWAPTSEVDMNTSSGYVAGRVSYYASTAAQTKYQADWTASRASSGGGAIVIFKT